MTAGGEKATLEINFQCKPGMGPSTQRISVGIDVCVADTPPNECSLQNSELIASQSIKFSFVKYCLKNPSHNIGWWLFTLFIFVSSLTCIYGCVHNFQVKGHRNIDIIPGAGMLREVLAACHRNGFLSACKTCDDPFCVECFIKAHSTPSTRAHMFRVLKKATPDPFKCGKCHENSATYATPDYKKCFSTNVFFSRLLFKDCNIKYNRC